MKHHTQQTELSFKEEDVQLKFMGFGRWLLTVKDQGQFLVGFRDCSCYRRHPSIYECQHIEYLRKQAGKVSKEIEARKQ